MPTVNGRAMKARGSAFERDVAQYLRDHGHRYVERAYGAGRSDDRGDLDGLPRWVVEVKACRALDLAGWCDEAKREQGNAGSDYAAVVAKRRGKAVEHAYVVMTLSDWARLVGEVGDDPFVGDRNGAQAHRSGVGRR